MANVFMLRFRSCQTACQVFEMKISSKVYQRFISTLSRLTKGVTSNKAPLSDMSIDPRCMPVYSPIRGVNSANTPPA